MPLWFKLLPDDFIGARPATVHFSAVRFLSLLALLLLASRPVLAADTRLLHVWPAWRDADSFERISEYFGSPERHDGLPVLRSQPTTRAGYYFLARVKTDAAQPAAKIELTVIRPDSPDPKTFAFTAALPAGESVLHVGLTGADWPGGSAKHPVAWKLVLSSADGRPLAERKSFLWEKSPR